MHRILIVAGIVICLLAAACSGNSVYVEGPLPQQSVATDPQDSATFPNPASLARALSEAPSNASGRIVLADDDSLPLSLNMRFFLELKLTNFRDYYRREFYPKPADQLGGGVPVSYKGYRFSPAAPEDTLEFTLDWEGDPPAPENVFVALADFDQNGWQCCGVSDPGKFVVDFEERFRNSEGEIYFVIILFNEPAVLRWVRLGGNAPPFAGFLCEGTTVPQGPTVFNCTFGTFDADGELARLEFDFDGDGAYEHDNGTDLLATWEFTTPGARMVSLRAIDNEGLSTVYSIEITVNDWRSENFKYGSVSDAVVDASDMIHLTLRSGDDYYYAFGPGNEWTVEQFDADLLAGCSPGQLVFDHDGVLNVLALQGDRMRVLVRRNGNWELLNGKETRFDFPEASRKILAFDSHNRPHLACGTNEIYGVGTPGPNYPSELRYWSYDGKQWNLKLNIATDDYFFGMGLDDDDTPYLGYMAERQFPEDDRALVTFPQGNPPEWAVELVAQTWIDYCLMKVTGAGAIYIVSHISGSFHIREDGLWQKGPSAPYVYLSSGDMELDSNDQPVLVRGKKGGTAFCTLGADSWNKDMILEGGQGQINSADLALQDSGGVHLFALVQLDDWRYVYMADRSTRSNRICHFWK